MKHRSLLLVVLLSFPSISNAQSTAVTDSVRVATSRLDTLAPRTNWGLGVTLGTPAGLNAVLEGSRNRHFGRISGMILPTVAGGQAEFGCYLTGTRRCNLGLSAILATSYGSRQGMLGGSSQMSWSGAGFALSSNLHGFFLQAGLTWGSGSVTSTSHGLFTSKTYTSTREYASPQVSAQIGYMYEFAN